jgi:hypothetical protein
MAEPDFLWRNPITFIAAQQLFYLAKYPDRAEH